MPNEDRSINRLSPILVLAALLALAAPASGGGIADEPCPNVAGENTNTCPPGTVLAPYELRFREREGSGCGPGRQTFHHDSGELPPGLVLTSDGRLRGTPLQSGRFRFYVEMREPQDDPATCAGKRTQKQFTLPIRKQVSIVAVPASLPRSEVGVPFRLKLRARGGTGLFTWKRVVGELPSGVRLHPDGSIAGIPRRAGTYRVAVRVRDTELRSATWTGTVAVARRLTVRTARLPAATLGQAYSATLVAEGGTGSRVWKLVHGRLPRGIRLAPELGRLIGRPKKVGTYAITVRVRDGLDVQATARLRIVVTRPKARR
jgi:Putative Ig domain